MNFFLNIKKIFQSLISYFYFLFILFFIIFQKTDQYTVSVNKEMKLKKIIGNKHFFISEIFYPNLFQHRTEWDIFFYIQLSIFYDKKPNFINSLCFFKYNNLNCNINYFSTKSTPKIEILSGEYESLFKKITIKLISLEIRNYFYVKLFEPYIIKKNNSNIDNNKIEFEIGNLNAISPEITKVQKCQIQILINNQTNVDSICEINQNEAYLHCSSYLSSYLSGYNNKKIISISPINGIFLCENSKIILYLISFPPSKKYENNIDFSNYKTDIKTIALYLPQYHTFQENDLFWGKGFTEWTNVRHGFPLVSGHYQPRIPDDSIGYYNLLNLDTLKFQAKLAKEHGIYGFGIYYYWFSLKKLMEKPIDLLLEHKEINIKFFLIWANENWTRSWNGGYKNVLISQKYLEKDPKNFIMSLKKYILDERYIKINNKPVIGIYKPLDIPKIKENVKIWRKTAVDIGIGHIFLLVCNRENLYNKYFKLGIFDGVYEFPPTNHFKDKSIHKFKDINRKKYHGYFYNFDSVMHFESQKKLHLKKSLPFFRGTMAQWDNASRKKGKIFQSFSINYSLKKFYDFNKDVIKWTRKNHEENKRFIFINAWNEWGEGTYLEPDKIYGYAHINALSKALFDLPLTKFQNFTN